MNAAHRDLFDLAVAIAKKAYQPYSRFRVGAAVLTKDGRVFLGVNVENAAYPLGICAEKTALANGVTHGYKPPKRNKAGEIVTPSAFEAIAITASPCGGCRQWLYEFDLQWVIYKRDDGSLVRKKPLSLLPDSFMLRGKG